MEVKEVLGRFRSNIVIQGLPPFIEDTATRLEIEDLKFEVNSPLFTNYVCSGFRWSINALDVK